MNKTIDRYDMLLTNMQRRFTVDNDGSDCTLGEFMLIKATEKKQETALTVAQTHAVVATGERAVSAVVSYVNDKLTIKTPPAKDKTIKSFPVRTSASAFLSAAVACAFVFSFCLIGAKVLGISSDNFAEASAVE